MFVSLQRNPLRRTLLLMTFPLIKSNWTLLFCRVFLALRISTTRTSLTTLVKSTIQRTEIGLLLNHSRNRPVVDPTINAIGSIALGSTTRLCLGITTTLNTTNLQPGTSSMITQLLTGHIPRRGIKRQAVDNLEHLNVQYQVEALLHNFKHLDVSKVPMLQGLPAPQQEQLITGVVHTLTTYREELHQSYRPDDPPGHSTASSSAPPDYFPPTDPISDGTGLPLPVPDSASMSLNSTSTESQNTLEPPFPLDRLRD